MRCLLTDTPQNLLDQFVIQIEPDLPHALDQRASLRDYSKALRREQQAERAGTRYGNRRASTGCKIVEHDLGIRIAMGQRQDSRFAGVKLRHSYRIGNCRIGHNRQPVRLTDEQRGGIIDTLGPDLRDHRIRSDDVDTTEP